MAVWLLRNTVGQFRCHSAFTSIIPLTCSSLHSSLIPRKLAFVSLLPSCTFTLSTVIDEMRPVVSNPNEFLTEHVGDNNGFVCFSCFLRLGSRVSPVRDKKLYLGFAAQDKSRAVTAPNALVR